MSDRIRELIELCYEESDMHDSGLWFNKEKFAELIVKDVVEQIITRERTDGEWYQTDIFKHFGVEE